MAKEDLEKLLIEKARELLNLIKGEIPDGGFFEILAYRNGSVLASVNYPWEEDKDPLLKVYDA